MSKKLLSIVLALALVASCFAVSAFAIGGYGFEDDEDAATYTQTWALSDPVDIGGGKYTVDVLLTANYVVGPIQFKLVKTVNAGSLTLTGAAAGSAIPANWLANVAFKDASGIVAIIPNPAVDAVNGINNPSNAVVAKLTFTASSDVVATLAIDVADAKSETNPGGTLIAARMSDGNVVTGTAITGQTVAATNTVTFGQAAPEKFTVSFDSNGGSGSMTAIEMEAGSYTLPACTFTAPSGYEFKAWSVNGVEKAVGDTISVTANTTVKAVWIVSIVPPTLVAVDGTLGVVDTTRTMLDEFDIDGDGDLQEVDGFLLGYDPDNNLGSLSEVFEVVGDGSMEIITTDAGIEAGVEVTTGTMVNVLDLDGNVVATYVVIVFGDVDCNGVADGYDSGYIDEHDAWMFGEYGQLFGYQIFAGDVDVNGTCDGYDSGFIGEHDAWMLGDNGRIDVAGILASYGF